MLQKLRFALSTAFYAAAAYSFTTLVITLVARVGFRGQPFEAFWIGDMHQLHAYDLNAFPVSMVCMFFGYFVAQAAVNALKKGVEMGAANANLTIDQAVAAHNYFHDVQIPLMELKGTAVANPAGAYSGLRSFEQKTSGASKKRDNLLKEASANWDAALNQVVASYRPLGVQLLASACGVAACIAASFLFA